MATPQRDSGDTYTLTDDAAVEYHRARQALSIIRALERAHVTFVIRPPLDNNNHTGRWLGALHEGQVTGEDLADCMAQLAQAVGL
jgi:hypothetical protein